MKLFSNSSEPKNTTKESFTLRLMSWRLMFEKRQKLKKLRIITKVKGKKRMKEECLLD